ncbi:MAG: hypothetical protein LUC41_00550, partial [Clostridiales bacterium]|nr:hypothetical protein [Clostridiales bacterium]
LEGICFELGNGIETMRKYVGVSEIYVNGGLTNSEPFNKIQCNVYGEKIIRRGKADATARGALMVAAASMGAYVSVAEAFETIGKSNDITVYLPQQETVLEYQKCRAQMNRLYKKIWGGDQVNGEYQFNL